MRRDRRARTAVRATALVRGAWGGVLLLAPERVLAFGGQATVPAYAVAVARALGARQVLQGVATAVVPTRSVAALGASVDALHAGTNAALAAVSPRWRRVALFDLLVATAFAASGWACRPRTGAR